MRNKVLIYSMLTTVIMLVIIVVSRQINTNTDKNMLGGPCTYETTASSIVVKSILEINPNQYDILLGNNKYDTLLFYMMHQKYLDSNEIKKIHIGDTLTLKEDNITSGTCTPHILKIELLPYSN